MSTHLGIKIHCRGKWCIYQPKNATTLQAQTSAESFDLNFIEDASGQMVPVGVMEDGSVHYPLFGKRIGVIENGAVLIDDTQQRFELLE